MLSNSLGLYLLDVNYGPQHHQLRQPEVPADVSECALEGKTTCSWEPLVEPSRGSARRHTRRHQWGLEVASFRSDTPSRASLAVALLACFLPHSRLSLS